MPTKERAGLLSAVLSGSQTVGDDNNPPVTFPQEYRSEMPFTSSRTGVPLVNWRSVIKSGSDATTPMTASDIKQLEQKPCHASMVRYVSLDGFSSYYSESFAGNTANSITIPGAVSGTDPIEADNQALMRAYSALQAQQGSFQGIVSLGELGSTIRQLRRPFQSMEKFINSYLGDLKRSKSFSELKNRNTSKNRRSFLRTAADSWLEVAFGIKPLISDVKDLTGAILQQQYGVHRTVCTGTGRSEAAQDRTFDYQIGTYLSLRTTEIDKSVETVRYKVFIDTTAFSPTGSIPAYQKALGFDPASFVPSVYNLIPWSFLVDYFVNLGDLIEAGCASQTGVKFVLRTHRFVTTRVGVGAPILNPFTVDAYTNLGDSTPETYVTESRLIARTSQAGLGMPSLTFSLPGKATKYTNILALIASNESDLLRRLRR